MKLICDCGAEIKFEEQETEEEFKNENGIHCNFDEDIISLYGYHDEVRIWCRKCGKEIHIWAS